MRKQYNIIEKKDISPSALKKRDRHMSFNPVSMLIPDDRNTSKDRDSKILEGRKDKSGIGETNLEGKETDKCILW
jgi:hypothetical protein